MSFYRLFLLAGSACKIEEMGGAGVKDEYRERYQQFGLNVVYYRKKKRLSQTQLAELADIHRTYISAIEPGKVGFPSMSFSGCPMRWKCPRSCCLNSGNKGPIPGGN